MAGTFTRKTVIEELERVRTIWENKSDRLKEEALQRADSVFKELSRYADSDQPEQFVAKYEAAVNDYRAINTEMALSETADRWDRLMRVLETNAGPSSLTAFAYRKRTTLENALGGSDELNSIETTIAEINNKINLVKESTVDSFSLTALEKLGILKHIK